MGGLLQKTKLIDLQIEELDDQRNMMLNFQKKTILEEERRIDHLSVYINRLKLEINEKQKSIKTKNEQFDLAIRKLQKLMDAEAITK